MGNDFIYLRYIKSKYFFYKLLIFFTKDFLILLWVLVLLNFYITQGHSIFITSECAPLLKSTNYNTFIWNSRFILENLLKKSGFNCVDMESGVLLALLDENIKAENPNSIIATVKRPDQSGIKGVIDLKNIGAYM